MVDNSSLSKQPDYIDKNLSSGWIILGLFAIVASVTGGASRFDAVQIIPLRMLSALSIVFSISFIVKERLKDERALTLLFGSLVLIVALQLVPLPPSLWQSLPQRGVIAQLDATLGLEGVWRPLSMTPMRTSNMLGSIIVPGAGLLLAVAFSASSRTILRVVAGLGVLNALLGILQVVTGRYSLFYFYEVTNRGSPVGILANENHAAIFAACSMLVVTFLGLKAKRRPNASLERMLYSVAFLLILFVSLVGGSRAGLVAAIGAILVSLGMLALSPRRRQGQPAGSVAMRCRFVTVPGLIVLVPLSVVSLTVAAFLALGRVPAFRDLLAQDSFQDLRWSIWPVIANMLKDHWFIGAGFGSFEQIYHIYEPSKLLMPSYVNQAHNDWAQYTMEGGAFAGLLFIGLLVWFTKRVATIAAHRTLRVDAIFWVSIFAVVSAGSLIDYPLRTPLFQIITVWLLVALSRDARNVEAR